MNPFANVLSTRCFRSRVIVLLWALLALAPSRAEAFDPHFRFPWPVSDSHNISSGGNGYHCYGHDGSDYYAIDFNFPVIGQEVDATQGGVVVLVGYDAFGYGIYVDVDHGI